MSVNTKQSLSILALSAAAILAYAPVSQAFNFGNMMNPSRWMNGGDRYNDRYDDSNWGSYDGPYGGYGYPGAYGSPYGTPYGMPGFGAPPAGYGAPYGGAPVAGPGAMSPSAPAAQPKVDPGEVEALKRRIEELESRQSGQPRPQTPEWPSAPAFRPMNQY